MTNPSAQVQPSSPLGHATDPKARPFTPETLAERWSCSAEKVRQMIHRGELAGFRLGKLFRIPAVEVERYECAFQPVQNTSSSPIEENLQSRLAREEIAVESRLARLTLVSRA
jgi:excisionase family DNA binding protein